MGYVVCQNSKCQQTHSLDRFNVDSKDIKCDRCNGTLIDEKGNGNFSQNEDVIPVMTTSELNNIEK